MNAANTHMFNYVGVDISKHNLDVDYNLGKNCYQEKNNEIGFKNILKALSEITNPFVVVEATGGYEMDLVYFLLDNNINATVINPKKVRDFAKAMGKIAKTDKIDASVLVKFAETFKPLPYEPKSQEFIILKEKVNRRSHLIHMRTMEINYLEHLKTQEIIYSTNNSINRLSTEISELEKDITLIISANSELKQKYDILTSCKGVGRETAIILITALPELGKVDRKKIAALSGLAPYNRDSGQMKGKRSIIGGRSEVRNLLFMACWSAIRYNSTIKKFYESLVNNGVMKMKARVACMRKLLVILNAMIRENSYWNNQKNID